MANSSKRTARRAVVKTWRAKALELRISGLTIREIATTLGKAISTVHEAIECEIREIPAAGVNALREVQGAQLDALVRGHLAKARRGDAEAAHVVISAIRQKAKLFGLDAPTRNEHTGANGGPIRTFDMSKLSSEQIDRLIDGDISVLEDGDAAGASSSGDG